MTSRLIIGMAVLAAVAVTVPAMAEEPAGDAGKVGVFERDVVEVAPGRVPISFVTVDNRLGDVRVEGHDGDGIIIHAFKRGPDNAALDRLKVSLVPDPEGPVRIGTRLASSGELAPLAAGSVRIDLVISVPRGAGVKAQVWNGRLAVASVDQGAELRANDGEIEVRNCSGRISTSIAVGKQQFAEIVGDIDAQGINGDLSLDLVRGQRLAATVHHGDVVGRKVHSRNVSIFVTQGNITFAGGLQPGGKYRLTTYRGNIEVRFANQTPVRVAARSRDGDVKLPSALRPASQDDGWVTGRMSGRGAAATMDLATAIGAVRVATF